MDHVILAEYLPSTSTYYSGNRLVDCLPPLHSSDEFMREFRKSPSFLEQERGSPDFYRMSAVTRLRNYLVPLPAHFDIIDGLGLLIRTGYEHRNPANEYSATQSQQNYALAMRGTPTAISPASPTTAPAMALFGMSGVGKTSVVERILNFLPKVVLHQQEGILQIVWLKVECSLDGGLRQMLLAIADKADELVNGSYRKQLGTRPSTEDLIKMVEVIAKTHRIGLIVFDELQHLQSAKASREATMNFFVQYANTVRLPFMCIGTLSSKELLQKTFQQARRIGDSGVHEWVGLRNDSHWEYLVTDLWKYQWTKKEALLTPEIASLLHKRTQGVHGLLINLFQLTQLAAIQSGTEKISTKLINEVADRHFAIIQRVLVAFAKGKLQDNREAEMALAKALLDAESKVKASVGSALPCGGENSATPRGVSNGARLSALRAVGVVVND